MNIKFWDIKTRIVLGLVLFAIALLNSVIVGALSFSMLSWWGMVATVLFLLNFGIILIELVGIPTYHQIKKLLTKK